MSVLKLYGHPYSPCTKKVKIALLEKGVPFVEETVDLVTGEHKRPEYKKIHPFGVVPALDDDGFILYECRAIVKYLEQKYKGKGTELVPTDLKAYGLAEQGAYLESQCFDPPGSVLLGQLFFRKLGNPNHVPDEEIVKTQRAKLVGVLQIYDQILGKQKYIGGDTFTMADIFHLPYLMLFVKIGESENLWKGLSNVERWYKDISERESVKASG